MFSVDFPLYVTAACLCLTFSSYLNDLHPVSFILSRQLLFFNMPLTCYLCWSLHHRCRGNTFRSHFVRTGCRWWTLAVHLLMLLLLTWQAHSCYFLLETYGPMAFFLSPVRTWALGLGLLLVYRGWTGPTPLLRDHSKSVTPS